MPRWVVLVVVLAVVDRASPGLSRSGEADGGDNMATLNDIDRQAQFIQLVLFILGAVLTIVGWYNWAT
jgi:hypothetical protein